MENFIPLEGCVSLNYEEARDYLRRWQEIINKRKIATSILQIVADYHNLETPPESVKITRLESQADITVSGIDGIPAHEQSFFNELADDHPFIDKINRGIYVVSGIGSRTKNGKLTFDPSWLVAGFNELINGKLRELGYLNGIPLSFLLKPEDYTPEPLYKKTEISTPNIQIFEE